MLSKRSRLYFYFNISFYKSEARVFIPKRMNEFDIETWMNIDKFKNSERLYELIPELKDCNGDYKKVNRGYFFVI